MSSSHQERFQAWIRFRLEATSHTRVQVIAGVENFRLRVFCVSRDFGNTLLAQIQGEER